MEIEELHFRRYRLIESLRKKGIHSEKVLDAMGKVDREKFVNEAIREKAYEDRALPIAGEQTISQPFTVAFMTMMLNCKSDEKILEIGTGSGYQTAVLCEMGCEVHSIERIRSLYESAKEILHELNYHPKLYHGDGTLGLPDAAPFDGIIITAGAPSEPLHLLDQLKTGGHIVVPVGDAESQAMEVIEKSDHNRFKVHEHSRFKFVPLIGERGW